MLVITRVQGQRAIILSPTGECLGWFESLGNWKFGMDLPDEIRVVREEILSAEQQAALAVYDGRPKRRKLRA